MSKKPPVIEVKNVTRILPLEVPVTLVNDVSLSIYPGEFVSITGPSGSGKSSLLYLMGLLDRPTEGQIIVDDKDTTIMSDTDLSLLRLNKLGFVFQFHFLLAEFTVMENIMIPMNRLGKRTSREIKERTERLLEDLGIADQAQKHPSQLSGGQRQRVAVGRAVANEPRVILADEPTGNLDTKSSASVYGLFRELVKKYDTSIIMVTHDMDIAKGTDRNIHIIDGKLSKS